MTRLKADEAEYVRPHDVDPDAIVSVFRVPPEVAGMRLDLFLQSQLRRTSRTRTQEIIRLSAYDATGKPFDPHHHEAVMQEASDKHPPMTVVQTFQQGYRLGERILRPAKVKVSK